METQVNRPTNGESDITWYLDSDPGHENNKNESTETICTRQPWRAYWPPKGQELMETWRRSEFPEVLLWRFDRTQPFDRPWRTWTRSICAMEEQAVGCPNRQSKRRPGGRTVSEHDTCLQATSTQNRQSLSDDLDDLIRGLQLQAVSPVTFHFLAHLDLYNTEKPYLSRLPSGTDLARTNTVTDSHSLNVFDVSGHENSFTLEESGFQFAKCSIQVRQWTDSYVCSEYIPMIEGWLMQHLKCSNVFIYAYNFRGKTRTENKSTKAPFLRAHCDTTAASCFKRLQLYFSDRSHALMKERVRFLNVWRSISTPVQDCPLALCDFRTVKLEDLVPVDIIFPHYQDEAYEVLYNPDQRWVYKKGMELGDVLLFKLGDNSPDEAPLCPHSAFMDPSVPKRTPSRLSIEVRGIIIG